MAKGHAKRAREAKRGVCVNVEFTAETHGRLAELARRERRSLRNLIMVAAERLVGEDGVRGEELGVRN